MTASTAGAQCGATLPPRPRRAATWRGAAAAVAVASLVGCSTAPSSPSSAAPAAASPPPSAAAAASAPAPVPTVTTAPLSGRGGSTWTYWPYTLPRPRPIADPPTTATTPPMPMTPASAPADGEPRHPAEAARETVRSAAVWIARGVDGLFGDRPFDDGGSVQDGRLNLTVLHRRGEGFDVRLRFNARFRLPNIEEKTYLFIGRDNPRELVTDRPTALSNQQRLQTETDADRAFFAGLGRALTDDIDGRIGFRGGLKPYAQVRYTKPWTFGPDDLVQLRETVFWSVDDHLGSTTAVSYDHDFSPSLTSRWLTAATITEATRDWEWQTSLSLFKSFTRQRLLTLSVLADGVESTGVRVPDYGVELRWEQPVYEDWLLGEFVIGKFWPRYGAAYERESQWAVGAGVKLRF